MITQNHHFLKIGFFAFGVLSFIMLNTSKFLVDIRIITHCNTKVNWNFNSLLCHSFMGVVNTIM